MSNFAFVEMQEHARRLLTSTQQLVSTLSVGEATDIRDQVHQARIQFSKVVRAVPADSLVMLQAQTLLECLHEASIEFELAQALGSQDPYGSAAAQRATLAVTREGRALLRGLELLLGNNRVSGFVN